MPVQDFTEIMKDLKNRIYHPVYFLFGSEPYFVDTVTQYIEQNILSEGEKGFNQTVVYGKDINAMQIGDLASRYPMMGNYQVVIVKEAQHIKDWNNLTGYAEKPLKTTILVLSGKQEKLDKSSKELSKIVTKHGALMESKKLYDNQVPAWITQYLKEMNYTISPKASMLLVEYIGNDLSRLANELTKLSLNVTAGKEISESDIEKNIGISKDYNSFELNKALGMKDVLKTNRIVNYFISNPRSNPMVVTIGSLQSYFNKIYSIHYLKNLPDKDVMSKIGVNQFFFREYKAASYNYPIAKTESIINLLHEYDLKSKGMNVPAVNEGELLKELVYKILH